VQTLDPGDPVNKTRIKASITAAIAKQVAGSNREEIAQRVEETYERILIGQFLRMSRHSQRDQLEEI